MSMNLQAVISKANELVKWWRGRRKRKLYEQWVRTSGLPQEVVPKEDVVEDIAPAVEKRPRQVPLLYVMLVIAVVVFLIGLILIVRSC